MSDHRVTHQPELERRREAVRLGRRSLGPGLQQLFETTVHEQAPTEWLVLLSQADELERNRRA